MVPGSISQKGDMKESSTVSAKAVKADDASVPVYLWDNQVLLKVSCSHDVSKDRLCRALNTMRDFFLKVWKHKVERDFVAWFQKTEHDPACREDIWHSGEKAIKYAKKATWWEWDHGSAIFFW